MARIHAAAFAGQGRAWRAEEFETLLVSKGVICVGDARAFALGRVIAGEAEVLTIATDPTHRRQGHARRWLRALETAAEADRMFLEVAHDNVAARALYAAAGYVAVGRRVGYYAGEHGPVDALILEKRLTDTDSN